MEYVTMEVTSGLVVLAALEQSFGSPFESSAKHRQFQLKSYLLQVSGFQYTYDFPLEQYGPYSETLARNLIAFHKQHEAALSALENRMITTETQRHLDWVQEHSFPPESLRLYVRELFWLEVITSLHWLAEHEMRKREFQETFKASPEKALELIIPSFFRGKPHISCTPDLLRAGWESISSKVTHRYPLAA